MKASYRWLRELVPSLDASAKDVAERLTRAGLEVEGATEFGAASDACIVARVVSMRPHPTKSGLRLVTVDRGGHTQEVVCGAPNVPEPGGLVVLAPLGAHLPAKNVTIAKRAIGGVESEGMLCSEDELGLGGSHDDGILVLSAGEVGAPLSRVLPSARDTIFEIGLTPNRPDGLGHVGLAREIAALYGIPFAWPKIAAAPAADVAAKDLVTIVVEDAERCPHYGAAVSIDVTIAPSPIAVRHRLQALGVRAISNIVDVTNLVMLEYGHPMHAFDLDLVQNARILVRRAKEGEILKTLDGVDRTLVADDLVICDGKSPVALAGVMGGASSEIHAGTKRVLFECAVFDPRSVRRTARRHGMHSESSHRFERGVDPADVASVLDRATSLAGGRAAKGQIHVQGTRVADVPTAPVRRALRFRWRRVADVTGVDVAPAESLGILERLGFEARSKDAESAEVLVPTHRPDAEREIDLIEEVIRVHGIDRVPAKLPAIHASRDVGGREALAARARTIAVSLGLSEAITYSFTAAKVLEALRAPKPTVVLKNPLGEHHAVMRTSLLSGLVDSVRNARRHGERDVRQFTVGPVFLQGEGADGLPREELRLAAILAGDRATWLGKPAALDAWDAKGFATALASRLAGHDAVAIVPAARADAPAHLHPRGAGFVEVDGKRIGNFGPLHPAVVEALELDGDALVVELVIESFVAGAKMPRYAAIPRFPAATRDVALVVKDEIPAGEVENAVRAAAGSFAEAVHIFDRFVGGQVPSGHASLAFRVVYRAHDRTLTDAEVDAAHANVVSAVGARFGATLRQ